MKKKQTKVAIPDKQDIMAELDRMEYSGKYRGVLRSTIYTLVVVAAVAVLIATLWLPFLRIYGTSMTPTLTNGEVIACVKTTDFETGDIIAFYYNNKILVKRVIAKAGDWINMNEEGVISVNGYYIDEPYVSELAYGETNITFPYQVPESALFVMGDHRATSIDSRNTAVGCVLEDQIVGKAVAKVWPLSEISWLK